MINSMNSNIDYYVEATSYYSLISYGKLMIGNKALEYYNDKNINDFIQIPWDEISHINANVLFNKKITRFTLITKKNGDFTFSTRDNKKTLQEISKYIAKDKLFIADTLVRKVIRKIKKILYKNAD